MPPIAPPEKPDPEDEPNGELEDEDEDEDEYEPDDSAIGTRRLYIEVTPDVSNPWERDTMPSVSR
ncbi:hypothetical protein PV05_10506 [Exophiala xenobiotica]|uniref:Uncharacterized protein n=1 Tax=Exophiala xenobiotica TaxID=348802 RepID=A0A0D2EAW7_9EURO|nr:uncharacterized protein PV05_10506 [Exophiala xenobiotica]KIW51820.1 hypothetical protein PV05_10506 [Exophiala xenobiotica]